MDKPKIFIATPMYGGQCHGVYVQGLLTLTEIFRQLQWTCMVSMLFNESLITRGRNALVANFLKTDCTHLFFIDSDIRFNAQEVPRMFEVERDVICGIYPKKEINWPQVRDAIQRGKTDDEMKNYTGSFVVNLVNYEGSREVPMMEPVEIWNGGTGFMLIKREVFEKMDPLVSRYKNDTGDLAGNIKRGDEITEFFATSIEPGTERLLSEDYHFCHVWRTKCDGKIFAAPWVTLAHAGSYIFEGMMMRHDTNPHANGAEVAVEDNAIGGHGEQPLEPEISPTCVESPFGREPSVTLQSAQIKRDPDVDDSAGPELTP